MFSFCLAPETPVLMSELGASRSRRGTSQKGGHSLLNQLSMLISGSFLEPFCLCLISSNLVTCPHLAAREAGKYSLFIPGTIFKIKTKGLLLSRKRRLDVMDVGSKQCFERF